VTNATGAVKRRLDLLPDGQELGSGIGTRTLAMGYSQPDGLKQKFTGHERDNESDLDFMQARYCSSAQGRFLSVDPYTIILEKQIAPNRYKGETLLKGYLASPQQWNRYAYVANNPMKFIDPTGAAIQLRGTKEEREAQLRAIQEAVGPEAGALLYINEVVVDGETQYYVGIIDSGPSFKGDLFQNMNSVAGEFYNIIKSEKVVGVEIVPENMRIGGVVIGPYDGSGRVPAVTAYTGHFGTGELMIFMLNPSSNLGELPANFFANRETGEL